MKRCEYTWQTVSGDDELITLQCTERADLTDHRHRWDLEDANSWEVSE